MLLLSYYFVESDSDSSSVSESEASKHSEKEEEVNHLGKINNGNVQS
jgi:hypothetical protein